MDYPKKKLDANPVRTVVCVNNTLPSVIQALDDQIDSMMELGDHKNNSWTGQETISDLQSLRKGG